MSAYTAGKHINQYVLVPYINRNHRDNFRMKDDISCSRKENKIYQRPSLSRFVGQARTRFLGVIVSRHDYFYFNILCRTRTFNFASPPDAVLRDIPWRKQVPALLRGRTNSALSLATSFGFLTKTRTFASSACL